MTNFPSSPYDGQQATINAIVYQFSVGKNTWLQATSPKYTSGQIITTKMLSASDLTVVSTTAAATNSYVNFVTYSYTPTSDYSYLDVEFFLGRFDAAGSSNDSWFSQLNVAGTEIAYGHMAVNSTGDGSSGRNFGLFPLVGRYTNTSISPVTIGVAARRDTADDSITISTGVAMWMKITEIAQ